jgi:hypothetical protein
MEDGEHRDIDPLVEAWTNSGEFPEFRSSEKDAKVGFERLEKVEKRLEELRSADVPEGKFKFPGKIFDEIAQSAEEARKECDSPHFVGSHVRGVEVKLEKLEEVFNEVDQEVGEKLWSLYEDPEISVGAHGTVEETDSDFGTETGSIMTEGLGCNFPDLYRTVAFQDRGMIHAHGNISFLDLLTYSYPHYDDEPLKAKKTVMRREGIVTRYEDVEVPASQYTVIVAIPKSYRTYSEPSLLGGKVDVENRLGKKKLRVSAIKPEFIVGMVRDGKVNDVVWNPRFDADYVRELSRKRRAEDEAKVALEEARKAEEAERVAAESEPTKKERIMKKFLNKIKRK